MPIGEEKRGKLGLFRQKKGKLWVYFFCWEERKENYPRPPFVPPAIPLIGMGFIPRVDGWEERTGWLRRSPSIKRARVGLLRHMRCCQRRTSTSTWSTLAERSVLGTLGQQCRGARVGQLHHRNLHVESPYPSPSYFSFLSLRIGYGHSWVTTRAEHQKRAAGSDEKRNAAFWL